jgi:hypothetical protein
MMYHILHQRIALHSFKQLTYWWEHRTHLYRSVKSSCSAFSRYSCYKVVMFCFQPVFLLQSCHVLLSAGILVTELSCSAFSRYSCYKVVMFCFQPVYLLQSCHVPLSAGILVTKLFSLPSVFPVFQ